MSSEKKSFIISLSASDYLSTNAIISAECLNIYNYILILKKCKSIKN